MSGVIVVGSGSGPGNGTTVAVADVAAPGRTAPVASLDPPADQRGWVAPAAIGTAVGILAGFGIGTARRRRMAV
jgi:hypothetical protein